MKTHYCTLNAMFSYSTLALHIHFVAWCCWFMKVLSRYHYMLLLILGSLAFHVLVIMVYPGRKWYTLFLPGQAHIGWRMWFLSLSEYPECVMESSSTVRWKAATQHSVASVLDPWHIHLKNEIVDFGSVWFSMCWKWMVTHDMLIIVLQYSCTHCQDLSLPWSSTKHVQLNGEILSHTA